MPIGSHVDKWLFPLCDPTTEDNPYGNDAVLWALSGLCQLLKYVIAANGSSYREILERYEEMGPTRFERVIPAV